MLDVGMAPKARDKEGSSALCSSDDLSLPRSEVRDSNFAFDACWIQQHSRTVLALIVACAASAAGACSDPGDEGDKPGQVTGDASDDEVEETATKAATSCVEHEQCPDNMLCSDRGLCEEPWGRIVGFEVGPLQTVGEGWGEFPEVDCVLHGTNLMSLVVFEENKWDQIHTTDFFYLIKEDLHVKPYVCVLSSSSSPKIVGSFCITPDCGPLPISMLRAGRQEVVIDSERALSLGVRVVFRKLPIER